MLGTSDKLPSQVDCIVLGTGLTNSIIAAACSRIGKSVLHLDSNKYYGDVWASFTFSQLIEWIKINYPENSCLENLPKDLEDKSRMFCIDLCPRVLFSNGSMVDLLVKSNVSRYHEFKNNIRILSMVGEEVHVLPRHRSDVFNSSIFSTLLDKRKMMKFIYFVTKFDLESDTAETSEVLKNADKPIKQFLIEHGLNETLQQLIINSLAMVKPTDTTLEACKRIKNFISAVERYGRSPFMLPLYGCGEFPQSFCRLSAVFGGTYCLNTPVDSVEIEKSTTGSDSQSPSRSKFSIKFSDEKTEFQVTSDSLILDYANAKSLKLVDPSTKRLRLSRAILITKESIISNEEKYTSLMRIPPGNYNDRYEIYLLELNYSLLVCPPEYNIVYIWTRSDKEDPESDLEPIINKLFGEKSQDIVWKVLFSQLVDPQECNLLCNDIDNLHLTSSPSDNIDYADCINEAERIFKSLCPDQDFLPRAPDPWELINE